ncbi:putative acyltransferase [Corynebacterium mustelae]|uniref:Putative acyltransferase n=1 Tax=Corynebacterium mustelae TaxID=571915 RepID=A0A0G3GV70_9CORY|nr:acyltransferase family protein [Corynebacterium mustelae]AKK05059.1 putative acyltransferase [Corynebacterium mustelae]
MDQLNASKYRYDLDGLRGLAIAFVVIFHVFVGKVSGGVDVFLLLSGYFFLGAQLRYATRPGASLNPWWPIWRTIRRLVPSLALVLGTTALAVAFLTPELRNLDLARQLEASIGYYQNWELATQGAEYGAASTTVSPLQHLWSMAVQGQFYVGAIIFATLIAVAARFRFAKDKPVSAARLSAPVLALITVVSFCYATYLHGENQALNYYSTFSRLWEMTLGSLLALFATRVQLNITLRRVFAVIGVAMVLTTGVLFDGAMLFPGPAALYPLGGAALVVLGGGAGSGWLASRFMRWLGQIAYPLYLWHWPLLIISTVYLNMPSPSVWLGIGVIGVSLVLADLTHRFIEEPLKQHGKRPVAGDARVRRTLSDLRATWPARLRVAGGLVALALVVSLVYVPQLWRQQVAALSNARLDPVLYPGAAALGVSRIPSVEPMPDPYLLADSVSPAWQDGCMSFLHDDPEESVIDRQPGKCIYGDRDAAKLVYVIGGSHAEQWMAALDFLGKEHGFRVVPIVRQACPAYVEERDNNFSADCSAFNKKLLARIKLDKPDVVISNSTRPLLEKARFVDEAPISYRTLWDFLQREGISFVGLRDNPWFLNPDGTGQMVSQCYAQYQDSKRCGRKREEVYAAVDPAAQYLNAPNQVAVDTADWFCPAGYCPPVIGNIYVYRDGNHISDDYVLSLAPLLWEQIKDVVLSAPVREAERPISARVNGYRESSNPRMPVASQGVADTAPRSSLVSEEPSAVSSTSVPAESEQDYPRTLYNDNYGVVPENEYQVFNSIEEFSEFNRSRLR